MPVLSVWAIRASLIYLVAGFSLGGILLAAKAPLPLPPLPALPPLPPLPPLLPAHMACLLFGWFLQLAIGVSFWIFPRFVEGPPRGEERLAWAALALLNAGVICSFAGRPPLTHALVALAGAAYAWHIVPRIRAYAATVTSAHRSAVDKDA